MKLGWIALWIVVMEVLVGVVLWRIGSRQVAGVCWSVAVFVAVSWMVCDQYVRMRK